MEDRELHAPCTITGPERYESYFLRMNCKHGYMYKFLSCILYQHQPSTYTLIRIINPTNIQLIHEGP